MTHLWIGIAVLTLAAVLIIVLPFFWQKRQELHDAKNINTQLAKTRMQELGEEQEQALLSKEHYSEAVDEVKLSLVDEMEETKQASKVPTPLVALLSVVLFASALAVYVWASNIPQVENWYSAKQKMPELGQQIVLQASPDITSKQLVDFALGLRTKLKHEPEDPLGWLLLGRVLASINDLEGALAAFAKSYELDPNHTGLLMSYSQTLLIANVDGGFAKAKRHLDKLLQMTPENYNAMGLLAVAETRLGNRDAAIALWTKLKETLPKEAPMLATVEQQLAALAVDGTELAITVTVSQALQQKLPESGFLFVFVQDSDTQLQMPAAVAKIPLAGNQQEVFEVTLTNESAMLPGFNLDSVSNGRLVARFSFDENVEPAIGELEGEVVIPIVKGSRTVQTLIVNKEIL